MLSDPAEPVREGRGPAISRGLQARKAKGKAIGRPLSDRDPEVAALLGAGWTCERVRKHLKVGSGLIQRVRNRMKTGG